TTFAAGPLLELQARLENDPALRAVNARLYAGDGQREGWVEVAYGESEEHWLRAALVQIRADPVRAPVPAERNCAGCEPNREGRCRYATTGFDPSLRSSS
ncbi:MAG: hypothetical protein ACHQ16_03750, partial [Candidatus Lutacidiplasmatales archaeon]